MKTLKKIASIGISSFFVLGTLGGALALDYTLKDYPTPFITNGLFSGALVVGANAAASDTIGQSILLMDLQTKAVSTSEETLNEISGLSLESSEEISLNEKVNSGLDREYTLNRKEISWDGDEYNTEEVLNLGDELRIETGNSDYKTDVVMEIGRGEKGLQYLYQFSTDISLYEDSKSLVTSEKPLEIKFLGKTLKISNIVDSDTFTASIGTEYFLDVGDSAVIDGKTVKLVRVGSVGAVVVEVDGVTGTISANQIRNVNGIEIKNTETFYTSSGTDKSAATLLIGKDTQETFDSGDAYIGESRKNPDWVWVIGELTTPEPIIGVENDIKRNAMDEGVVEIGDCYELPNNYVKVCLSGLTTDSYETYSIGFDTFEFGSSDLDGIIFDGPDSGLYADGKKVDKVFWDGGTLYYDRENIVTNITSGTNTFSIKNSKTELDVAMNSDNITIKDGLDNEFVLKYTFSTKDLTSVWYGKKGNLSDVSGRDYSFKTQWGFDVEVPKDIVEDDEADLKIPNKQTEVIVEIRKAENGNATISSVSKMNKIPSTASRLDSEISDPKAQNLIIVGGPSVNSLATSVFGLTAEDFTPNEAIIRLAENGNKVALLVAGYSAVDTRNAAESIVAGKLKSIGRLEAKVTSVTQKVGEYTVE